MTKVKGTEYCFQFGYPKDRNIRHYIEDPENGKVAGVISIPERIVTCRIKRKAEEKPAEVVSIGVSLCRGIDNFHRDIGRREALIRALKNLPVKGSESKRIVSLFWRTYLSNYGGAASLRKRGFA